MLRAEIMPSLCCQGGGRKSKSLMEEKCVDAQAGCALIEELCDQAGIGADFLVLLELIMQTSLLTEEAMVSAKTPTVWFEGRACGLKAAAPWWACGMPVEGKLPYVARHSLPQF